MSSLSPRLQVRVQQKQILTPGLVQMVSLLQLNRLELKEMISAEIAQNPVLEERLDGVEELTPEELQPLLEAERSVGRARRSIHSRRDGGPRRSRRDAADLSLPTRRQVGGCRRCRPGSSRRLLGRRAEIRKPRPTPLTKSTSGPTSTNIWTRV